MKNRLILLALAILCYGQMQAAEAAKKGWFANRWDRMKSYIPSGLREYTPYQQGSFKTYPPENVASRLASMRYLYGNDIVQDQQKLIDDYQQYLWDKYLRQNTKDVRWADAQHAAQYLANKPQTFDYSKVASYYSPNKDARFQKTADYMKKHLDRAWEKSSNIYRWEENLRPTIRQQEAEMLRPRTFYEYQHPDQYILNN